MLLSELNMRALGVSAASVLPICKDLSVEGRKLKFKITAIQSGYGSGKKTVISGSIARLDSSTERVIECLDIEKVRRVCASLCELTTGGRVKKRNMIKTKERTRVTELRLSLAVVRSLSCSWLSIDADELRAAFKSAREIDREKARKALQARAVAPILERVAKLSPEERALLLASLQ